MRRDATPHQPATFRESGEHDEEGWNRQNAMDLTDRIYRVDQDDADWSNSYISGEHRWTLPGLECPACRQIIVGAPMAYPSIQTPKLGRTATKKACRPVPLAQFEPLVNYVRSVTKRELVLRSCCEFGPLEGKVVGRVVDFMWVSSWDMLARKGVIQRLKDEGVKLPVVVEPVLKYPRNQPSDLLEFEIEPKASWDVALLPNAFECKTCHYFKSGLREGCYPPLLASSFPRDVDLARVKQAAGMIVANERFVKAVLKLGLQNIVCRPLEVSRT